MSQNHKNGQTTQTSNVKTARLLWVKINTFGIKIMSYVSILNVFCLDIQFARFSSSSGKLTISHIIAHWVVKFWVISICLISIEIYWHSLSHECSCVSILHVFCLEVNFARFSPGSGKLTISHIIAHCEILSYINIFNINRDLLTQAFTWM